MKTALGIRLLLVWVSLSAITAAYLLIDRTAEHHGAPTASTVVSVSAIGLALFKVWMILREFMEVRRAPALLRGLAGLLVGLMAAVLLGLYFAGKAVG